MKLVRLVVIVAALAGLLPGSAHAQGFKWWQDEKVKTELGLTAEQVVNLDNVFLELIPRMAAEKEALDKLEGQLSSVIRDANMNEAEIIRQIDAVEAARSALGKTRTLMIYRLYRSLSPDQRTKMKALHQKWEEERRKGGRR